MSKSGYSAILLILAVTAILLGIIGLRLLPTQRTTSISPVVSVTPTLTLEGNSLSLTLDELKSWMPGIVWEETVTNSKEVYRDKGKNLTEVESKTISGITFFSSQIDISVKTYQNILDRELTVRGWQQSAGGDGPTGGYWGYSIEAQGEKRYVEFKFENGCKDAGFPCKDGSTVFLSDEFEWK